MNWTVACFCGNLYSTTHTDACPSCREPLPDTTSHGLAAHGGSPRMVVVPSAAAASSPLPVQRQVAGVRA